MIIQMILMMVQILYKFFTTILELNQKKVKLWSGQLSGPAHSGETLLKVKNR